MTLSWPRWRAPHWFCGPSCKLQTSCGKHASAGGEQGEHLVRILLWQKTQTTRHSGESQKFLSRRCPLFVRAQTWRQIFHLSGMKSCSSQCSKCVTLRSCILELKFSGTKAALAPPANLSGGRPMPPARGSQVSHTSELCKFLEADVGTDKVDHKKLANWEQKSPNEDHF